MKKFEVGQRVVWVSRSSLKEWNEYEDDTTRGAVKSIDEDGKLSVKWDDSWVTPNPGKHDASELISEVEANKILSKLEKEFEAWAGPIREKMEETAKCLKEAGKLAAKQKKDLAEMHELTSPLISAMDDIGWRTSSLSC
jgi:hypothetical protein